MLSKAKQAGLSLLEFMVAVLIGALLVITLTDFAGNVIGSNFTTIKSERLNQELRTIMTLIERDIRRSGYVVTLNNAANFIEIGSATYSNPYATVSTGTAGCILYSYDASQLGTGSATQEQYGFLLQSNQVYMMTSGVNNCTLSSSSTWSSLSDPGVTTITALTFSPTTRTAFASGTSGANVAVRQITITLSGQLTSDPSVKATLVDTVKLENDQFNAS